MEVGDEFVDFKAFKAVMADWSITSAHKFTFWYQKSGKARSIVVCARAGCFFRVYAAMDKDRPYIRFPVALYLLPSCSDTTSGRPCRTGRNIAAESKLPTKFRLGAVGNTSFPWEACGRSTSNIVESLNNWILEARKLSIVDLLHSLWCKTMDLRFRHRQDG